MGVCNLIGFKLAVAKELIGNGTTNRRMSASFIAEKNGTLTNIKSLKTLGMVPEKNCCGV